MGARGLKIVKSVLPYYLHRHRGTTADKPIINLLFSQKDGGRLLLARASSVKAILPPFARGWNCIGRRWPSSLTLYE